MLLETLSLDALWLRIQLAFVTSAAEAPCALLPDRQWGCDACKVEPNLIP